MKKNVKLVKYVLLCAISLGVTSTVFTSCKDYDDDIDNLQSQIDGINTTIDELKGMIKEGKTITNVNETDEGVTITFSDETTAFIKHGKDGKPGENGKPGQDGGSTAAPETIYIAADPATGDWIMYYKEKKDGKYADEFSTFVLTGAKIGVTSLTYVPNKVSDKVGEVVFFPVIATDYSKLDKQIYEYDFAGKAEFSTVYAGWATMNFLINPSNVNENTFQVLNQLATGTALLTKADPTGIVTKVVKVGKVSGKGELTVEAQALNLMQTADESAYVAVAAGTRNDMDAAKKAKFVATQAAGVEAQHLLNDPEGLSAEGEQMYGVEFDKVALQVNNKIKSETADTIVTSDYISAKRLVVLQEDVMIGATYKEDAKTPLTLKTYANLYPLYTLDLAKKAQKGTSDAFDTYVAAFPVALNVPYSKGGSIDLKEYLEIYALNHYTNNGDLYTDNYLLKDLGFKGLTLKFEPVSYELAQVDQSLGTNINENIEYAAISADGILKFGSTAGYGRQPVVKVSLMAEGVDQPIMSKLLKMEIVYNQNDKEVVVDDLKDFVLSCSDILDEEYTVKQNGMFIDLDKVYDKLNVGKDIFVQTYITNAATNGGVNSFVTWYYKPTADAEWAKYETDGKNSTMNAVSINMSYFEGSATSQTNRLPLVVSSKAVAGYYKAEFNFATSLTAVDYKTVTFTDEFQITYPETSLVINPSMWTASKENMVIYGKLLDGTSIVGPLSMGGYLEDGFVYTPAKKLADECKEGDPAKSILHFALVDPDQYEGQVEIVEELITPADGTAQVLRHKIQIKQGTPIDQYAKWIDKKIKVKVWEEFNPGQPIVAGAPTTDQVAKATIAAPINSDQFDVVFMDPIAFQNTPNDKWFLVDLAYGGEPNGAPDYNFGHYLPVYRLFTIYDKQRGTTNGIIWDPADVDGWWTKENVEIGAKLAKAHGLEVTYSIDKTKNNEFVQANAKVDENGVLSWNNVNTSGETGGAVVEGQDQKIVVTVEVIYNWAPKNDEGTEYRNSVKHDVEVYVKPANTKFELPKVGPKADQNPFTTNGTDTSTL